MMKNKKYLILLAILLVSFFMFTGGVLEEDGLGDHAMAPTINSLEITTANPTIFQEITFKASVKANSYEDYEDDCDGDVNEDYEYLSELETSITVKYGENIVAESKFTTDDDYEQEGFFLANLMLAFPGEYTVIVTFKSVNYGEDKETSQTQVFTVVVGNGEQLNPGTYNLTAFSVKCSGSAAPYEQTNNLAGNFLTIGSDYQATLNVDFTVDAALVAQQPCLTAEHYDYNVSGLLGVGMFGNQLVLAVYYDADTRDIFGLEYDDTSIDLRYNDDEGAEYTLRFEKQ